MTKLYNTQTEITNKIREFLKISIPNLRKTQLNIIPEILFGMISSKSIVSSDIVKSLKNEFSFVGLVFLLRKEFVDFLKINFLIQKIFIIL